MPSFNLSDDNWNAIIAAFQDMEDNDLSYESIHLVDKKSDKYILSLECLDSEGIINHFTNYFNKEKINIEEMNTTTTNAPTTGSLLFNLDSIINIPENFNMDKFKSSLDLLSEKYNVTYKILLLKSE